MAFIQIMEYTTTRSKDVETLVDDWLAKTEGRRTAQRSTFTADRDRPNTFVQIVEFPSYEEAMVNSNLPETAAIAKELSALCDGPVVFRNLDVSRVETL